MILNKITSLINRGQERTVKAKKNIIGLTILKGISIVLSLIMVPMAIGFVNTMQYGIWLTLSSLVSWISFFDIGLGNGLKNKFTEAIAADDKESAKIYVSTTYALITLIITGLWLLLIGIISVADWSKILNSPASMAGELKLVVFIVATNFCFQFVFKLVNTLLTAIQKPAIASSIDTISQALIILQIFILVHSTEGSLVLLSLVSGCTYVIVLIISSILVFTHELKDYTPKIKHVNFNYAKDLFSLGFKFFFLQILSILFYSTNNIIIAQISGPNDVTVYNIAYKYMLVLYMGFTILITPFWSAFCEAYAKKDFVWMKRTYRFLLIVVAGLFFCGLLMLFASPTVYRLWIKDAVKVPFMLTALIFIYQIMNVLGSMHSTLIYGIGKIKIQIRMSAIICIANVPITVIACQSWGMTGLVSAQILLAFLVIWVGPYQLKKLLNQTATGVWNE
jgi:O-antigen/teichoic acid export membrane protein